MSGARPNSRSTSGYLAKTLVKAVQSDQRATALSVNNVLLDGVAILINLLLGGAADNHLPLALGMGAALCLAGFVLFMRGSRTQAA